MNAGANREAHGGSKRRLAVMDVGTNSVRLLIAEVGLEGALLVGSDENSGGNPEADLSELGPLVPLYQSVDVARIGQGVQATGVLAQEAMNRALLVLKKNLAVIEHYGAELVGVVATSAVRDASNADDFRKMVAALGIHLEIISGVEEARLSYLGAIKGLGLRSGQEIAVIDIGGGSTEIVVGTPECAAGEAFRQARRFSANIGAVRMTERHLGRLIEGKIDLTSGPWRQMTADISWALDALESKIGSLAGLNLIGVGGTATTLASMAQALAEYDYYRVHGYLLTMDAVNEALARLADSDLEQRKRIVGLQPERADIIAAGVEILRQIMKRANAEGITISDSDLLQGVIYDALRQLSTYDSAITYYPLTMRRLG